MRTVIVADEATPLQQIKEALAESEERFHQLAEATFEGVVIHDQGTIVEANTILARMFGYERSEIIGMSAKQLMTAEGYDIVMKNVLSENPNPYEAVCLRRDGTTFPVAIRGKLITYKGRKLRIGAVRDLSERQRAQDAQRRSEAKYRTMIEQCNDVIWTLDVHGSFTFINPRGEEVSGYGFEDLRGHSFTTLLHDEDLSHGLAVFARALGGEPQHDEVRIKKRDGAILTLSVNTAPIFEGGQVMGTVSFGRDVTDQKRLQARLIMADRMASVGTLAAGIAHEINNPLTYVVSNLAFVSEQLAQLGPNAAQASEAVSEARQGAERVRFIVRDLKTFSRGDEQRGPVDLLRTIESSINMAANEIRHRARLVRDFGDVPFVEGNESRLGQVFLNLLVNAAQAIPEGDVDHQQIRVTTRTDSSGRAVVEVADSGEGIPETNLRRIFEPFFTTKPAGVGTGLGLYICQSIVATHGGEIAAHSVQGKGSVFRVVLPPGEARPGCEVAAQTATPSARSGRILVVDDEPLMGRSVERSLRPEHEVVSVTSAREALSRLSAGERFDVILCDLMMPEMSGMDFHAELSRVAPDQLDRMVFLTGGAFTSRARDFLDRVPNQRIEKPFDTQGLRALIRDRLR